ncbi:stage II sporulation protein R [Terrisporobacter sp.]|jgi:stage II sporulation protein R|uniref:stage II sporulation protein R n=1 Tax=Terrisporobacter sp. TaxID=1965305 RepID=UPI002F94E43A
MNIKNIRNRIYILASILVVVLITSTFVIIKEVNKIEACTYDYKDKLIRFHVIANSDSDKDQKLKLKVRDEVISYLQPKLENSNSIEESEKIIKNEYKTLENISKKVISKNGYNYIVKVGLEYSNFPAKQYSSVVLPAGKYKALRIIIGEGKGKNWWCVMFPPLCFIDDQNGIIDEKTDKKLKEVLTEEEYDLIMAKNKNEVKNLEFKFKITEVFQNIF